MSAALAKIKSRAGTQPPPVSGGRPGTSVGFAQHQIPGAGNQVRTIRGQVAPRGPPQQQYGQQFMPQQQGMQQQQQQFMQQRQPSFSNPQQQQQFAQQQAMQQQAMMQQQQAQAMQNPYGMGGGVGGGNGGYEQSNMPADPTAGIQKMSMQMAVHLITQRLGHLELWKYEKDHEDESRDSSGAGGGPDLGPNQRIIDTSVLASLCSRLDALEKKDSSTVPTPTIPPAITEDIAKLRSDFTGSELTVSKHSVDLGKMQIDIAKMNRDLIETKDLLKTFMLRYDSYVESSENRFKDNEAALVDIESQISGGGGSDSGVMDTMGFLPTGLTPGLSINDIPLSSGSGSGDATGVDLPTGKAHLRESKVINLTDIGEIN